MRQLAGRRVLEHDAARGVEHVLRGGDVELLIGLGSERATLAAMLTGLLPRPPGLAWVADAACRD